MDKLQGHWAKRSILERDTGKFYNKYFYKRKEAHRVVVDSQKAKILSGYILIEKDLRSSLFWLDQIKSLLEDDEKYQNAKGYVANTEDRDRFNLIKGLFVASLTFYGKSFSSCEGRRVKLEKKNLDDEYYEDHDDAMKLRHDFAAHSGESQVEHVAIVVALDTKCKAPPYMVKELMQPDVVFKDDLAKFINLFTHAKSFAEEKVKVLSEKVYKDDVVAKGAKYWYDKT